jgi:hypothetical protein
VANADSNAAARPPLTYESLSISSFVIVVTQKQGGPPDYCTVLVRHHCCPPPHCRSSLTDATAIVIIIVLSEHAIIVIIIFIPVLVFLRIVNSNGHRYDQNQDSDEASHWGTGTYKCYFY